MWGKSKHINKHIRIVLLLIVGSFTSYFALAQEYNPYVKTFNAIAIDGKVYLSWTTRAGFTCQDIHIEVSRDSLSGFERRGTYYGICGDASEKNYTYVLDNPILNTLNYLKLELGNIGYSNTINLMVIKAGAELLILPHPITTESTLHFENKEQATFLLKLYNTRGNIILYLETRDEKIQIGNYHLPNGILYYDLIAEGKIRYRGKLLVI